MLVVGGLKTADDRDLMNLAGYISDLDIELDVPGPGRRQRSVWQATLQVRLQDLPRP
jgi:hypothetical protein